VKDLLLNDTYNLDYDRVYLFAEDLDHSDYQHIIRHFTELEQKMGNGVKLITYSENLDDLPPLSQIDRSVQNVVIFDGWVNEQENTDSRIRYYFYFARQYNLSVSYLYYSWFGCPKVFLRNAQYAFLYRMPFDRERRTAYKDLRLTLPDDRFKRAHEEATVDDENGFLLVDQKTDDPIMRYRSGLGRDRDGELEKGGE